MTADLVELVSTYRTASEAEFYAARLAWWGVDAASLERYLALGSLSAEEVRSPLVRSLVAEERINFFRSRSSEAARERRQAVREDANLRAIVDIAHDLGVSRQAVSKLVNGSD